MRIKVYEDRYLVEDKNISASQYENLATTLEFEFPEFVEKNGIKILTNELNKYIVFDIDQEENEAIIKDNKYSIPYEITKLGEVTFYVKLEEKTETVDMSDKLIWITRGLPISFNKTEEGRIIITTEKLDTFNSLLTQLNNKTDEVDILIEDIETKLENGEFKGDKGDKGDRGAAGTVIQSIEPEEEETVIWVDEEDDTGMVIDEEEIKNEIKEEINPILNEVIEISERAEAIAKGRATGYVFDTVTDLDEWLQDSENTSKLVLGDNLYIREVGVPDYWWDGTSKQILETQKVDLTEYVTQEEFNEDKIKRGEIVLSSTSRTVEYEVIENGLYLVISHVSTNNDCIIYVVTKMGSNAVYSSAVKTGGYVTFKLENRIIKVTGQYGIYTRIIKL